MKLIDNRQSNSATLNNKTTKSSVPVFKPKIKFIQDASIFKNLGITSKDVSNLKRDSVIKKSDQITTENVLKLDTKTAPKSELMQICAKYGIAKNGRKELLIERLIKKGILKPEHPEDEKNWSSKSRREDLMVACKKRVLATDGSKSDLMQRLQQYEDTRTKLYIISDGKDEQNNVIDDVSANLENSLAMKRRRLSDEHKKPAAKSKNQSLVSSNVSLENSNDEAQAVISTAEDGPKSEGSEEDSDEEISDADFEKLYKGNSNVAVQKKEDKIEDEDVVEEIATVISVGAKKVDSSPAQFYHSFVAHYTTINDNQDQVENEQTEVSDEEPKTKPSTSFFAWGSFVSSSGSPEKVKFIS